jgi:hypothetical protein
VIITYLVIALSRLSYPFTVEWLESNSLVEVHRILAGQSLYPAPTAAYVPDGYPPLYFGSFALAGYAAVQWLSLDVFGIAVWFVAAVVGHDLLLMPLYTLADRSAAAVFRHIPAKLPTVQWINYLRVPVVLSGLLLLIWFPLIFRLPTGFQAATPLSLNPYLWHWLAVTGALFLLSATALALRLRPGRVGTRSGRTSRPGAAGPPSDTSPGHREPQGPPRQHDQTRGSSGCNL